MLEQFRVSLRWLTALLVLSALGVACGSNSDDQGPRIPADIVLVPNQPKIAQGLTLKLTAKVVDAQGRSISGKTIAFTSNDETVVTVDPDGTMHSVGALGTARVTAESEGLTNFVDVEITQRIVEFISIPESLVINPTLGDFIQPVFKDFAGNITAFPAPLAFTSNNTALVQVNQNGFVLAGATIGQTTVTVTCDTFVITVPVRVAQIPTTIITDPINLVLQSGQNRQLSVTVRDKADAIISSPTLSYASDSPGLFSVSGTGLVTSLGGNGNGVLHVSVDTLTKDLGVFIGNPTPIALVHTTQTGTSMYQAAIGGSGRFVASAPGGLEALRGTLPGFTLVSPPLITRGTALGAAVNHAGTRAYIAGGDEIAVFDLTNGSNLPPILVPGGGSKIAVIVSPDDQKAYIGSNTMIYVADLTTGLLTDSIPVNVAFFLAIDPTGQRLYASEGTVREINLATKTVTRTFTGTGFPKEVAVSADGSEIFVADEAVGGVLVFNQSSGALTATLPGLGGGFGVAASAHLIVSSANGGVTLFDAVTKAKIADILVQGVSRRPAISPDEKTVIVPNESGWLDFIQ